jgi:thioester reductase-like protein
VQPAPETWLEDTPDVNAGTASQCVVITGATGVVGSALVPGLLADEATEIKLLIRADSPSHLAQRLQELYAFWQLDGRDPRRQQVEAVRGDVCLPNWGLADCDYQRLVRRATHVVHAAGNVKLNQPLVQARRSAVEAVSQTLAFAASCLAHGQFRKLEVVSTVGVAGRTPGLVREQPCAPTQFRNCYEQAKWEGERLLLAAMADGVPITIHRPSMVVGDSRTGRIRQFQVFYYLSDLLCGSRTWGLVPRTGLVKLDLVPVDYVARAIHAAIRLEATTGRILHLCAGPQQSRTLSELATQLRELQLQRGRRLPTLHPLSAIWFRRGARLLQLLAPPRIRRFARSLPYFLDYLNESQVFDTSQTSHLLAPVGWRVPAPDQYLKTVMASYWNRSEQP